ncbi:cytochrome P450 [Streptomyces sp. NBC_01244]|uniref:cytochrome P450 n=1 Tax=Streptomyces sp. NBC_01244 TaxID=2903797 RepID=UPI002E0DF754|nr:cytochrome P450 [Streptomyces sp. NBC_01244]
MSVTDHPTSAHQGTGGPPPSPSGTPEEIVARFNADPFGNLLELEQAHGTLFQLPLGNLGNEGLEHIPANGQWAFLTRPHQVKAMYEAPEAVASGAQANKLFFGTDESSVGYIDGASHRCRRGRLHPAFGGSQDYSPLVLGTLDRVIGEWPRDTPFPLYDELQNLTSQVITDVVCGNMSPGEQDELRAMLLRTENAKYTRAEIIDADASLRAFIARRIDGYIERADRRGKDDFLTTLLRLGQDKDEELTHDTVRDEVFSLLYTGFSTTANTLSWAFLRLLDDDRVRELLTAELREIHQDGREITRDSLAESPYLEAVLKEVLRLHPVTPLNGVRLLKQDLELDGYVIPAGTILVHCAYLLQRSPEVWKDPLEFRPERFLGESHEAYAWGAFGGGSRMCVGRGFSLGEMKAILTRVLTAHTLERPEGLAALPPSQMQGFFMAPDDHAVVVLRGEGSR